MSYKIVAPPWVGTMFCSQSSFFFWKEVYWIQGSSAAAAVTNLQNLAAVRASLMTPDTQIGFMTISDSTKFRDVYVVTGPSFFIGTYGTPSGVSLPAPSCMLARYGNATGKQDTRPLRGIPSSVVNYPDSIDPTATLFLTRVASFFSSLVTYAQIVIRTPGTPPTYAASDIAAGNISSLIHNRKTSNRPFSLYRGRHV